jgi:hypothetical protein
MQPPTCRLKLEKCKRADVPPAPREEIPQGEGTNKVVVKSVDPHAEETVVELDEWLIDFANLFRENLGIDPDKCVARCCCAYLNAWLSVGSHCNPLHSAGHPYFAVCIANCSRLHFRSSAYFMSVQLAGLVCLRCIS